MRTIFVFLFSLLLLQSSAECEEISLQIGPHSIRADVAYTPRSRAHGLMARSRLCTDCGMLFVFPAAGKQEFWMKDTLLPLSIAFIDASGKILNISEMEPNTLESHYSQGPALYALEMNKGWFTQHAIKPQQIVKGLQQSPRGK